MLAMIAASLVMFGMAGLYTGVIARDFIASHVDAAMLRSPPNLFLVFAGYLFLALLMSLIYPRFAPKNRPPVWSGLQFGLATAVCWLMPYSLVLFGVYHFPYSVLPMDFAWALLEQGTGGVVIGLIHGNAASTLAPWKYTGMERNTGHSSGSRIDLQSEKR
jgi:hypothetical protein